MVRAPVQLPSHGIVPHPHAHQLLLLSLQRSTEGPPSLWSHTALIILVLCCRGIAGCCPRNFTRVRQGMRQFARPHLLRDIIIHDRLGNGHHLAASRNRLQATSVKRGPGRRHQPRPPPPASPAAMALPPPAARGQALTASLLRRVSRQSLSHCKAKNGKLASI